MPLSGRQTCARGNHLEQPEELGAIKPAALLTSEEVVGTVLSTLSQPFPERPVLVQERFSPVFCNGLRGTERAFESFDDNAAIFQVQVIYTKVTDFRGSHSVLVRDQDHCPFTAALGLCCPEHCDNFTRFEVKHRHVVSIAGRPR